MNTPTLETDRLILRPFKREDVNDVFKCWESDPDVAKYMFWSSHNDIEKTKEWIQFEIGQIEKQDWYRFAIVLKETNELIGTALIYYEEEVECWEIGYNLGKKYWCKGYTTEAMKKVIEFAIEELNLSQIVGRYAKENPASWNVMSKLGFKYEKDIPYACNDGMVMREGIQCRLITKLNKHLYRRLLMEEMKTMEDYAAEWEASFRKINVGDILKGTVIGISETEITLDLGYYTDGIVRLEDASDDPTFSIKTSVEMGQTISATVIKRDDGAGHILLSMKEATAVLAWDKLKEYNDTQENITVKISEVTKGGVVAYLEGIRGFIPASKLSLDYVEEADLENYLHQFLEVRVIHVEEANKRLVMSAREILKEAADAERAKKISNVEVGLVTEGVVESLKPYGAFVNLGNGLSGLLHISQICQKRIKHPGVVLKEGQTVKVKIIEIKDGKLSLSMKALEDVAAKEIEEEVFEIPETEEVTTSLGSLLAGLKL